MKYQCKNCKNEFISDAWWIGSSSMCRSCHQKRNFDKEFIVIIVLMIVLSPLWALFQGWVIEN